MSVKKTIAIVGATESKGIELANQLAGGNYHLLLVSNDGEKLSYLSENIFSAKPGADIDTIECVKDGCWEADVIILAVACSNKKLVAGLIKEVATQKIVVNISDEGNAFEELQQLLPYSKIVEVSFEAYSERAIIRGNDEDANEDVALIFNHAGYHTEILQSLNH